MEDCYLPHCVSGDGYDRVFIATNREMPGPKVEVKLLQITPYTFTSDDKNSQKSLKLKLYKMTFQIFKETIFSLKQDNTFLTKKLRYKINVIWQCRLLLYTTVVFKICEGDTVVVAVTNHLEDGAGATIHWHGMRQRHTPYMDGGNMVTQCPITHRSTFVYVYTVPLAKIDMIQIM